jgi:hypothetical protein
METIVGELIAATLAAGSGCTRSDWIDRTLVTVDVTGVWSGTFGGLRGPYDRGGLLFELEQGSGRVARDAAAGPVAPG